MGNVRSIKWQKIEQILEANLFKFTSIKMSTRTHLATIETNLHCQIVYTIQIDRVTTVRRRR